jgi:general secretion pathway protein A
VREVGAAIVQRAAREVFDDAAVPWSAARGARQPLPRGVWAGLGALAGAAAMAAAAWGLRPEPWGAVGAMAAKPSMGDTAAAAEADTRRAARVRAAASGPASEVQVPRGASAPSATPLASFLARLPGTETSGLHALAGAWDVALAADADACAALARDGLRCYRNRRASLQLLRQLDRPVVLALHASAKPADAVYAVLRRLEGDTATLEGDGTTLQLSLQQLAQVWRGDMATLWRTPPGMPERGDLIDTAEGQAWLDRQLTAAPAGTAAADDRPVTQALRQSQIRRFQMAQGLTPDGRAGPLTLMLLNRVSGVNEPRLRTGD